METGIVLEVTGTDIVATNYEGNLSERGLRNVLGEDADFVEVDLAAIGGDVRIVAFEVDGNTDPNHGYVFLGVPDDRDTLPASAPVLIAARENGRLRALSDAEADRVRLSTPVDQPFPVVLVD